MEKIILKVTFTVYVILMQIFFAQMIKETKYKILINLGLIMTGWTLCTIWS